MNMDTMQEWVFVAPREHMGTLVAFLEGVLETLPCIPAAKVLAAAGSPPPHTPPPPPPPPRPQGEKTDRYSWTFSHSLCRG